MAHITIEVVEFVRDILTQLVAIGLVEEMCSEQRK